jgi:phosphatidylglycerophosphate synthase
MFDDLLRRLKDRLSEPFARALGPACPPRAVSLLALAVGLAAAWLAAERRYEWAVVGWLANRVLDGLDGAIARVHGRTSDLGAYVDIMCDFIVYAVLPIGLVVGAPTSDGWRALALLLASFYLNAVSWLYLSALLERRGLGATTTRQATTIAMPAGLVAGAETIVFYTLFLLFPSRVVPLFLTMAALVLIGVAQRAVWAGRRL